MGQPEAKLQRDIQKYARRYGWVLKVHGNQYTPAGTPDLIGCIGPIFWAMEVKTPSGVLSPIQAVRLEELAEVGAAVAVVRDLDYAKQFLDEVATCAQQTYRVDWSAYWREEVNHVEH